LYEVFAERNNNQIILATHSPHIIASARSESVKVLKIENGFVEVIEESNQVINIERILKKSDIFLAPIGAESL